ncbi:MAG: hypothetical protein ACLQBK_16925 [Candidatus Sulfotelmatobacter sp.]
MVHITLYIPNSAAPEEYDVEGYGFHEGRLHFTVGEGAKAVSVATTVPFLIRQPVEEKAAVVSRTQPRPARRSSSHTAWS